MFFLSASRLVSELTLYRDPSPKPTQGSSTWETSENSGDRAMALWHCGMRDCIIHPLATDLCSVGPWFCGRVSPPCPGHSGKGFPHICPDVLGHIWHCGARDCPTHGKPIDNCPISVHPT